MDFGTRLKELRKNAGLTQAQLGERLGLTKSVISFYELQERSPSPGVLIKLAEVFHVSTDYLLGMEKRRYIDITDLSDRQCELVNALVSEIRKQNEKNER